VTTRPTNTLHTSNAGAQVYAPEILMPCIQHFNLIEVRENPTFNRHNLCPISFQLSKSYY